MTTSNRRPARRPGIAAALADTAGAALQTWASRREVASTEALLYRAALDERREREGAAMHDGLFR
jgi:hypothetical protein